MYTVLIHCQFVFDDFEWKVLKKASLQVWSIQIELMWAQAKLVENFRDYHYNILKKRKYHAFIVKVKIVAEVEDLFPGRVRSFWQKVIR